MGGSCNGGWWVDRGGGWLVDRGGGWVVQWWVGRWIRGGWVVQGRVCRAMVVGSCTVGSPTFLSLCALVGGLCRGGSRGVPSSYLVSLSTAHHLHNFCAGKRSKTRGTCTSRPHLHNCLCRRAGPPLKSQCADDPATSPAQLVRR